MRICESDGCERPYYSKGLCTLHYQRSRDGKVRALCIEDACEKDSVAHGKCDTHYRKALRAGHYNGKPCSVSECSEQARVRGYCQSHYHINKKYDIDPEQYETMLKSQEGLCAICATGGMKLYVDHNHDTGNVRGLLCRECNSGIGFLKDSIEVTLGAVEYLKKWRS